MLKIFNEKNLPYTIGWILILLGLIVILSTIMINPASLEGLLYIIGGDTIG